MKVRLLAVMAVVVVGVMAGTSPAMAQKAKTGSSKSQWTNQHKDNKVFGEAINNLRKSSDSTNFALGTIAGAAQVALLQLKDGLTVVADSYTNFEYGVVQLYAGNDAIAGAFAATPRIDPTVEQSTVTAQFACLPGAITGQTCDAGDIITAKATVRSANIIANNKTSTPQCRVQISQGNTSNWVASLKDASPFITMVRSTLTPPSTSAEPTFPAAMVSSDSLISMTAADNSINQGVATGGTGGFAATTGIGGAAGMLQVTLSCLAVPKS